MLARAMKSKFSHVRRRLVQKVLMLARCHALVRRAYLIVEHKILKRNRVLTLPSMVKVNTGYLCNLRCPHCPTGMLEPAHAPDGAIPRRNLTLENARKIAARLNGVRHVLLFGWGEPFLNRDVFNIIAEFRALGKRVDVDSNLNIKNETVLRQIETAPIQVLSISLDGADQDSYASYRVRGDFSLAVGNMTRLARTSAGPWRVEWQYVISKKNRDKVETARRMAQAIGVPFRSFDMGLYQDHFYNFPESERREWWTREQEDAFARRTAAGHSSVCAYMYDEPFIDIDGRVYPCCHAPHAPVELLEQGYVNVFGDLENEALRTIWNNEYYQHMRARFAGRSPVFPNLKPICLCCRMYLAARGERQDALPMFNRSTTHIARAACEQPDQTCEAPKDFADRGVLCP